MTTRKFTYNEPIVEGMKLRLKADARLEKLHPGWEERIVTVDQVHMNRALIKMSEEDPGTPLHLQAVRAAFLLVCGG